LRRKLDVTGLSSAPQDKVLEEGKRCIWFLMYE
jgi:hypothetical protein